LTIFYYLLSIKMRRYLFIKKKESIINNNSVPIEIVWNLQWAAEQSKNFSILQCVFDKIGWGKTFIFDCFAIFSIQNMDCFQLFLLILYINLQRKIYPKIFYIRILDIAQRRIYSFIFKLLDFCHTNTS